MRPLTGLFFDHALAVKTMPALFEGLGTTLALTAIVMMLGVVLAVPLTAARMSSRRIFNWPARAFVIFFRGAPVLILLYLVYYGFGQIEALREGPLWVVFGSAYACAVVGLTLNHAAYLVEIGRGALDAVPNGLVEASNSLGLTPREALLHIRLPLAFRIGLKAYQNEVIMFTKGTAVVSVITVTDLTAKAHEIFEIHYDPITPIVSAAVLYWVLINAIRVVFDRLELYLNRHTQPRDPIPVPAEVSAVARSSPVHVGLDPRVRVAAVAVEAERPDQR